MWSYTRNGRHCGNGPGRLGWLCVVACTLLAISTATPSAETPTPSETTTPRLQDPALKQYRAYRRMHAFNEKFGQEAWLECWTELDDQGFRLRLQKAMGQLESPIRLRTTRREVARIKTIIRQKEQA